MQLNWDVLIIPIFFLYGLAFYSMGLALWVESGRASELKFARSMRLLSVFGLLHGTHEWLDLLENALRLYNSTALPLWGQWFKVVLLAASFIALTAFGLHLQSPDRNARRRNYLLIMVVGWYAASCIIVQVANGLDEASWIRVCDVLARYILGIPASVLAAILLYDQRKHIANDHMRRFTINFSIAAVSLMIYGVIGQVFVKPTLIFPANIINETLFINIFGFPVQVLRACLAVVLALSMISTLRVLEVENQERLKAIEARSREELSRLNASLKASEAEARKLLALRTEFLQQVTAAQESERKRIARELHDGTGQMLTGLALGLRGMSVQVHKNPDLVSKRLSNLEVMTTHTIGELRALIQDLRPPQLDDMGLVPAIRSLLERLGRDHETQFELKVKGTPYPLPAEVETILFRIIQEGVNNITKHAQASYAYVCITYNSGLELCICDDGKGCDPDAVLNDSAARTAWGLVGIDERANLINADWCFESEPGKGTKIKVHVPTPDMPDTEVDKDDNKDIDCR